MECASEPMHTLALLETELRSSMARSRSSATAWMASVARLSLRKKKKKQTYIINKFVKLLQDSETRHAMSTQCAHVFCPRTYTVSVLLFISPLAIANSLPILVKLEATASSVTSTASVASCNATCISSLIDTFVSSSSCSSMAVVTSAVRSARWRIVNGALSNNAMIKALRWYL